jgi:cell division transport system ATP-binding protein
LSDGQRQSQRQPEPMIQVLRVFKHYAGGVDALSDISFTIDRGEFVFVTGPSGAGKTTLLRLLFRAEPPSAGGILVNGRNVVSLPPSKVASLRREIGVVFQDFKLLADRTVLENISYILKVIGVPKKERQRRAYALLRRVGIQDKMHNSPRNLSGGEQQRVAIARALINDPVLLLADEPTGNLDPDLAREIMTLFIESNQRGCTVLVATHDRELIRWVGARTIGLEHGRLAGAGA